MQGAQKLALIKISNYCCHCYYY